MSAIAGALCVNSVGRRPLWLISTAGLLVCFAIMTALAVSMVLFINDIIIDCFDCFRLFFPRLHQCQQPTPLSEFSSLSAFSTGWGGHRSHIIIQRRFYLIRYVQGHCLTSLFSKRRYWHSTCGSTPLPLRSLGYVISFFWFVITALIFLRSGDISQYSSAC